MIPYLTPYPIIICNNIRDICSCDHFMLSSCKSHIPCSFSSWCPRKVQACTPNNLPDTLCSRSWLILFLCRCRSDTCCFFATTSKYNPHGRYGRIVVASFLRCPRRSCICLRHWSFSWTCSKQADSTLLILRVMTCPLIRCWSAFQKFFPGNPVS